MLRKLNSLSWILSGRSARVDWRRLDVQRWTVTVVLCRRPNCRPTSSETLTGPSDAHGTVRLVEVKSGVALIVMDRGENRINHEFLDQLNSALDDALSRRDVKVIITTGRGKFYSNGDDLDWLRQMHHTDKDHIVNFLRRSRQLEERLLTLPVLSVAAINGHAFAGGCIMAMCHDLRLMQTERGWMCLNEAQLGIRLPRWLLQLLRLKFGGSGARSLLETAFGRRFTAEEARLAGMVDATCPPADLLNTACRLVEQVLPAVAVDRDFVEHTKRQIFSDVLATLRTGNLDAAKSQLHDDTT